MTKRAYHGIVRCTEFEAPEARWRSDDMRKRKLPIGGVQTFSDLRKDYDVYIDKTMHVFEMASRYKAVFLSRPRRFGKSLLCSTIESLFRGEKEFFEGLAISGTNWKWMEHPVIHLELAGMDYSSGGVDKLVELLNNQLDVVCEQYGISIESSDIIEGRFARIITELSRKLAQVVVIIDEYDSPLLGTINKPEANEQIRERLRGFYGVLKQCDRYLRFAFVTGVTKFAQISVFSGFNQPKDISMASEYCDICGVTQDELETYFAPEIEAYAPKHWGREAYLERLKSYYNGYNFTKDKVAVYNTYGILNHFDSCGDFSPYWSMSGAPSFLQKFLEARESDIVDIETAQMSARDFADYKDNTITLFPLLYQAGYLTISDYDDKTGIYRLDYPNVEVRQTLAMFLANSYSKAESTIRKSATARFVDSLMNGKPADFMSLLKQFLNKVDYSLSSRVTEHYFEFAVSNIINMLGLECKNEAHTANGCMDSVVFAGDYIYIFEFKVDKPVEDALWQLEEKDYISFFADSGKRVVEVGVVFSREMRNIVEWEVK